MFAQSMVEYGALATVKSNLLGVLYSLRDMVSDAGAGTWTVVGGVALVVLWSWRSRSRGKVSRRL